MGEDTQPNMAIRSFQPRKVDLYSSRFRGIQVKGFPKEAENKEIMDFLSNHGIPGNLFHNMVIKGNGKVVISDIENIMCQDLIKTINNVKFHDRILECNGVIPLSPLPKVNNSDIVSEIRSCALPVQSVPDQIRSEGVNTLDTINSEGDETLSHINDEYVTRRSSVPEADSLGQQLTRRKSVRDLVTDFSSCLSNLSSGESEGDTVTPKGGKKVKKKKRKPSSSPLQDSEMKKVDNKSTPS